MVRFSKIKPDGTNPAAALRMKQAAQHEYPQQLALHRKAALKFRCQRDLQGRLQEELLFFFFPHLLPAAVGVRGFATGFLCPKT